MFRKRNVDSCEIIVDNVDLDCFVLYFFVVIFAAGAFFGVIFGLSTNFVHFVAVVVFALFAVFSAAMRLFSGGFVCFCIGLVTVFGVATKCFEENFFGSAEINEQKTYYFKKKLISSHYV